MNDRAREYQLATLANPQSNSYSVRGRYNEYADTYIPMALYGTEAVRDQQNRAAQAGVTLVGNAMNNPTYSTGEMGSFDYYAVTIRAIEVLTARIDNDNVLVDDNTVRQQGVRHSVLKARVRWTLAPSYEEEVTVDIGSGVDMTVGPTNCVYVDILRPNPQSIPSVLPDNHREANFNTIVTISVACSKGTMTHVTGRFTQQVFVRNGTTAVTRRVELRPDTRRVQVFADTNAIVPPRFLTLYPFDVANSPVQGDLTMEPADSNSAIVDIPQLSTHMEFNANAFPAGNRITLVQELLR